MNYPRLRELRDRLMKQATHTQEEKELLDELKSISSIIDKTNFSLATSSKVCPACGRAFDK